MNGPDIHALLELIDATGARTGKEELIERNLADPMFKRVLLAACDSFTTYGITPPKVKKFGSTVFDMGSVGIWEGLDLLAKRELTGNAAKTWVKEALETLDQASSDLLYRILAKDLRAGFGANTVNRVLPGTIVQFKVMLSQHYEAKRIKEWPVPMEPKLDGLRAMSLCNEGRSKAFSRVGNPLDALDCLSGAVVGMVQRAWEAAKAEAVTGHALATAFYKMLGGDAGPSLAVDAEGMAGAFAESVGSAKRKSAQAENMVLYVFDVIPYALMVGDQTEIKIPWRMRRQLAEFVVRHAEPGAPIRMTEVRWAENDDQVQEIFAEHRATSVGSYIAAGAEGLVEELEAAIVDKETGGPKMLEGSMVKVPSAGYVKKKGHLWLKMKAEETEDLRIVGWFEGEEGGRLEGKFAGWLVDREDVQVAVGGGFSHKLLAENDALVRELPAGEAYSVRGKIRRKFDEPFRLIEVEYHEVTPDGSLRHPRFVRYRDDKDENLRQAA